MNAPNLLTFSRLLGIPVVAYLLLAGFSGHDLAAAAAFAAFSLTDSFDGALARRFGQVTDLGKFMDPLADKLFILAVLVLLVDQHLLAPWVVLVIFARELLITLLRSVGLGRGSVIAASWWGKLKTVSQTLAVLVVILSRPYAPLRAAVWPVLLVALAITVGSGVDYLWRFRHVLAGDRGGRPSPGEVPAPQPARHRPAADPAAALAERLLAGGLTVAVAESCTGGLLGAALTEAPGSSRYFRGGLIAYSDRAKLDLLDVPPALIEAKGAVSGEVALAMAEGGRRRLCADVGLAVTGIAGPGADGSRKPVGRTYVAAAAPGGTAVREHTWDGDRPSNRARSVEAALALAVELLTTAKAPS